MIAARLLLLASLLLAGCDGSAPAADADADDDTWPAEDDCDDTDAAIHPRATEVCDDAGVDEDCDGLVNEADPSVDGLVLSFPDDDGDGFGAEGGDEGACSIPEGNVADAGDCDDADSGINPAAEEDCLTDTDEDCDGRGNCPA